ncbi:MAG: DUF4350 domain-containing protein [Ornithinimicrobium sp.]
MSTTMHPPTTGDTAAGGRRRVGQWTMWAAVVLVLMVLATLLAGLGGSSERPLDPNNPTANGMQALAEVLRDRGVEVEVVRGVGNLPPEPVDGATVLVSTTTYLSADSGRELRAYSRAASSLVILSPEDNLLEVFDIDAAAEPISTPTSMSPECSSALWEAGDRVSRGDTLIDLDVGVSREDSTICLPPSPGYNAGGSRSGYLVELAQAPSHPRTVIAGLSSALTNRYITQEANAATGLRLLGQSDRLVWIIPSISDAGDATPVSLVDVLPESVVPATVLALVATGVWALVRGRRLGKVTTEPLPVVIHAIETTASRGRLYQEARDRSRALASLQLASRRRLASRLGLSMTSTPDHVVQAVALATGRHTHDVHRLLADPEVGDDATLVQIAREVRSLEDGMVTL